MPIVSMNRYLTLDEAAARSGKSRATIRNWIRQGRFPTAHKSLFDGDWSGEKWWVLDRELEQLIGRRLAPGGYEIEQELGGIQALIEKAIETLAANDDHAKVVDDLRFAAQSTADLIERVQMRERLL
jgi:hypothetical protein